MTDNGKIEVEVFVPPGKVALPWELWRLLGAVNFAVRRAVGDDTVIRAYSFPAPRAMFAKLLGVDQAEGSFHVVRADHERGRAILITRALARETRFPMPMPSRSCRPFASSRWLARIARR